MVQVREGEFPKPMSGWCPGRAVAFEVCHGKLLPFLDTLEHTLSCARLLRSTRGRWFLPPQNGDGPSHSFFRLG